MVKKIKEHDFFRREFLWDSTPQNLKFHRLYSFFIFNFFSYTQKNTYKYFHYVYLIYKKNLVVPYLYFFYRFCHFTLFFLWFFKSKIRNCWNRGGFDCCLYI